MFWLLECEVHLFSPASPPSSHPQAHLRLRCTWEGRRWGGWGFWVFVTTLVCTRMFQDKGLNTCGCRGRGWGPRGGLCGWIAEEPRGGCECYGDTHGNQAKCSKAFWRMCVSVCVWRITSGGNEWECVEWRVCSICVHVCISLHVTAFPYGPGVS